MSNTDIVSWLAGQTAANSAQQINKPIDGLIFIGLWIVAVPVIWFLAWRATR